MPFKSCCFRLVKASFFVRFSHPKVGYVARNDELYGKKIVTFSGQLFYKPLYVVPQPHTTFEYEDKIQCVKSGEFLRIYDFKAADGADMKTFKVENNSVEVIHKSPITGSDQDWCDGDLAEDFKSTTINLLNYYSVDDVDDQVKPLLMSSPAQSFLINPSYVLCDFCLSVPVPSPDSNKNVLLLEEINNKTGKWNTEHPDKASEDQLLIVKDMLCSSFAGFFQQPQNYSLYHRNIEFQNNIKSITTKGIGIYMTQMYLFKCYGFLHYSRAKVEILKVTHHTEDCTVRIRWRVNGVSRRKFLLYCWQLKDKGWENFLQEHSEWFDGFSVFSINRDGLVYKHVCDKMVPDNEQLAAKPATARSRLMSLLGLSTRPQPVGGIHCVDACSTLCNCAFKACRKTAQIT